VRASRESQQFLVRLPKALRSALAKRAAINGRSMNSEMLAAIEQHLSRSPLAELSDRVTKLEQQLQGREAP